MSGRVSDDQLAADLAEAEAFPGNVQSVGYFTPHLRELQEARKALARAVFLAEHLHALVPREVWRAHGGDDMQGHYEGDYHAEQVAAELKALGGGS